MVSVADACVLGHGDNVIRYGKTWRMRRWLRPEGEHPARKRSWNDVAATAWLVRAALTSVQTGQLRFTAAQPVLSTCRLRFGCNAFNV